MKLLFTIGFIFLTQVTHGQRNLNLGLGIISIGFDKQPIVELYDDTLQINPQKTIVVSKDSMGEFVITNRVSIDTWFQPEGLWLDFNIFIIRAESISGSWVKVIVNNSSGNCMWLKKDPNFKFIKWSSFLVTETTSIVKQTGFDLDIKNSPTNKSRTIKKIETSDCFEVIEIKGEWIHIKTNEKLDCNESLRPIKSGWIKWKINNQLAVGYGLAC